MRMLITYDVTTTTKAGRKRLFRIAKLMERYGVRVQQSVFECLLSETKMEQLLYEVEEIMHMKEDSLLFYRISESKKYNMIRLGLAPDDPLQVDAFIL